MKVRLETTLRALRRSKGWSEARLAAELGISQQWMSQLEHDIRRASVGMLAKWVDALDGYLVIDVRVSGERALRDARHAALQNRLAADLRQAGWLVATEVSFNHFGDRGRIDVLAWHPVLHTLLVVEIKTRIDDVQDVIGRLDVKRRVAPMIARERGWQVTTTVPVLVIAEHRTARRRVADHAALFEPFVLRARSARRWLHRPTTPPPGGILLFEPVPDSSGGPGRRAEQR